MCTQAALTSLEKEAKENVYAVLDPHIQYEITINKHGEPPKYLSLSKPLTHQRAHAFDPNITNEINNNHDNRFSTFKTGPPKARRSNRSDRNDTQNSYVCKTNNDIQYSKNPFFGMNRGDKDIDKNEHRTAKNYSRMYERNNSGRRDNVHVETFEKNNARQEFNRMSNRSRKDETQKKIARELEKERSFEEFDAEIMKQGDGNDLPRPGKVREIASRFNNSSSSQVGKKDRPKPLQSYRNQAYLDHIFPDAVEV